MIPVGGNSTEATIAKEKAQSKINAHQAQLHFEPGVTDTPLRKPTLTATPEQVEFFKTNGFLFIDALTDKEEIESIQKQYDQWFKNKLGREHGNFFDLLSEDDDKEEPLVPQLLWPSIYGQETGFNLYNTQMYANAYAISTALLGENTAFKGDHAIMKPASSKSVATPWHQDESYWDPNYSYEALGVWIALQPVTLESGCMQFIPKSHLSSVLCHHTKGNNPKIHGLEVDHPEQWGTQYSVACPLPAGGATFHHCRTLHYTGANKSKYPRRAYTMSFQRESTKLEQPRANDWNETKQTEREKRAKDSGWSIRAP
ncbi:unnamed protein product [Didymodactylos carnosus]|uniref:Phytanoyl-CoA dioxygenase n=1 Tax=Didymodactylos carnosus TaxID=1234261 RepID=A0A813YKD4_9BILA|nr:unnamed protein product [Didymodactylos carnosus]CAF1339861.1 unnamed protein product [Didymodactylos carnosus]CAF3671169.1 unnamed protein product [Didymodactylos carnosus]CAF4151084.1 unnamed protein product [Didymodactylos carnosus]